jgi:DNA-binding PadR family transcriptional regulator
MRVRVGGEMRSRSESLEFALLGFLSQNELHGYELRKRLTAIYGPFRALSFSVIYPQLRRMLDAGLIEESFTENGGLSRRSRIVYRLSNKGRDRFITLTETVSPDSWEDEGFEVRFAFFGPTSKPNRVRILEGRHRRLKERAEILRAELEKSPVGIDKYLEEWRRHSLESAEREIVWLEDLINTERK